MGNEDAPVKQPRFYHPHQQHTVLSVLNTRPQKHTHRPFVNDNPK